MYKVSLKLIKILIINSGFVFGWFLKTPFATEPTQSMRFKDKITQIHQKGYHDHSCYEIIIKTLILKNKQNTTFRYFGEFVLFCP